MTYRNKRLFSLYRENVSKFEGFCDVSEFTLVVED